MEIKNLNYLRNAKPSDPDFNTKLAEALQSIAIQATNTEQQTNANPAGNPSAPPPVNNLNVTGRNGQFSIQITDHNEIYRGINYHVEHDTDPNFTNPQPIHLGPNRTHNVFLGNQPLYWRAFSSYGIGPPSAAVYHGSAAQPAPVTGGGSIGGPAFQVSQGSGTGPARVGLEGPGKQPFRSITGAPPVRGK